MRDILSSVKHLGMVLLLVGATALLAGCATAGYGTAGGQTDASGVDSASMRRGRALAITSCQECHRYYWPREYSPAEWPGIVRKMGGPASLSKAQMANLELYLVESSRAARE